MTKEEKKKLTGVKWRINRKVENEGTISGISPEVIKRRLAEEWSKDEEE